jgi:hypothetical protein
MLQDAPRHEGYLATCWTIAMLALALGPKVGVSLSATTVRVTWRELGLRWGRPRLPMPTQVDPAPAYQQGVIAQAIVESGPEAAILYADESRLP